MEGEKINTRKVVPRACLGCLVLFLVLGVGGYFLLSYLNKQSAIEAVLEWGRLAPFPERIRNLEVSTEGSMFTRSFRVSFDAETAVIDEWREESPGFADAEVEARSDGTVKYTIKPGGGANWAEVIVGPDGHVSVYVSWS